jgi:metallo-beta-lactamase family protein
MPTTATLQCLGGAGTVTGSKYLLTAGKRRVLLDCGLFQGLKQLRLRNWEPPTFDPKSLDSIVLSHAHIDHCGYLPLVVRQGFRGPVFCTPATASLLRIVLPDAAHLQEEDAAFTNRHRFSKHAPALPLYTRDDAARALELVQPRQYQTSFEAAAGLNVVFRRAGHILGSASIDVEITGQPARRLVFSGDLGRWGRPMLRDPEFAPEADVLLIESTYGDRLHNAADANEGLARIINAAVERQGPVIVPAFAVGRTQELIWRIRELEEAGRIPHLPVFIDSPMATDVTDLFCRHPEDHDIDMKLLMDEHRCPLCCKPYHFTRATEESKALNQWEGSFIVISASGMATGGRVVHHLKHRVSDKRTTVLLVGFQAAGTRGRALQEGAKTMRMHGQDIPVRAHVEVLHGLSAHADRSELLRWIGGFTSPPRRIYVVHGEPTAAEAFATSVRQQWPSDVRVAQDQEVILF